MANGNGSYLTKPTPLDIYLGEIHKPDLLSKEEEVELAKNIESHCRELVKSLCRHQTLDQGKTSSRGLAILRKGIEEIALKGEYQEKVKEEGTGFLDQDHPYRQFSKLERKIRILNRKSSQKKRNNPAKLEKAYHLVFNLLYYSDLPEKEENQEENNVGYRKLLIPAAEKALSEIKRKKMTKQDQEILFSLKKNLRSFEKYRDRFVNTHLRLVVGIAKKYLCPGRNIFDLIQEGNMGLINSVIRFDYQRGARFANHAFWWIRQAIVRSVEHQSRTVRIPTHALGKNKIYQSVEQTLYRQLDRKPEQQEIAEKMERSLKVVERYSWLPQESFPLPREDEDQYWVNFIEDTDSPCSDNICGLDILKEIINSQLMPSLTSKERIIIKARTGMKEGYKYGQDNTLQEVGDFFDVSRQRIEQLEKEARVKLRETIEQQGMGEELRLFYS